MHFVKLREIRDVRCRCSGKSKGADRASKPGFVQWCGLAERPEMRLLPSDALTLTALGGCGDLLPAAAPGLAGGKGRLVFSGIAAYALSLVERFGRDIRVSAYSSSQSLRYFGNGPKCWNLGPPPRVRYFANVCGAVR